MDEDLVLRKGKLSDAQAICALIKQNYNVKNLDDAKRFFKRDIKMGTHYVVAEYGQKIVGFVTWREHDRPYHELAELHAIAVDDSFKGKGLSKLIFEKLVCDMNEFYAQYGHSLRKLYVLTHANNSRAIRFYEKIGFKKEVAIPNHYYKGVDELILSMYFD